MLNLNTLQVNFKKRSFSFVGSEFDKCYFISRRTTLEYLCSLSILIHTQLNIHCHYSYRLRIDTLFMKDYIKTFEYEESVQILES